MSIEEKAAHSWFEHRLSSVGQRYVYITIDDRLGNVFDFRAFAQIVGTSYGNDHLASINKLTLLGEGSQRIQFTNVEYMHNIEGYLKFQNMSLSKENIAEFAAKIVTNPVFNQGEMGNELCLARCSVNDFPDLSQCDSMRRLDIWSCTFANSEGHAGKLSKHLRRFDMIGCNLTTLPMMPTTLRVLKLTDMPLSRIPLDVSKSYNDLSEVVIAGSNNIADLSVFKHMTFHVDNSVDLNLPKLKRPVEIHGNVTIEILHVNNLIANAENVRILQTSTYRHVFGLDDLIRQLKREGRHMGVERHLLFNNVAADLPTHIGSRIQEYVDGDDERVRETYLKRARAQRTGRRAQKEEDRETTLSGQDE